MIASQKLFALVALLLCSFVFTSCNVNDTALSFLGWVKKLKGDTVNLSIFENSTTKSIEHTAWTELLQKYVDDKGLVKYASFKQDETQLQNYLDLLSNNPPAVNWTKEEKLAYWINAYNAFTIKLIIGNLPVISIKDIGGNIPMINSPWDIKFFKIGDINFDLNTIEHDILRQQFEEPRIHFAINCASIACPKLLNTAYTAQNLEAQLNQQAIDFINDISRNKITTEKAELSKIFDWFKVDFTKNGTLKAYINQYATIKIEENTSIELMDYNWNLNKQ